VQAAEPVEPVRVEATLDSGLSRWLWLVKWVLVIPHLFVLFFLWIAFGLLTIVAFVAILVTGRYPRSLFDFNVGVLRWTWRVGYYGYGVLGTDRYPPFTLADVPDYPAHLDVAYPDQLSRGLVLVKWWLLAIPQYIVVGIFVGGAGAGWAGNDRTAAWGAGGLIGILVLVAAVVLAFTGTYPRPLFDFVLGLQRWTVRVVAYAALMTDRYPPFRLDTGGTEPATAPIDPPLTAEDAPVGPPVAPYAGPPPVGPIGAVPTAAGPGSGWTAGKIVSLCLGSLLALVSIGMLAGGGALAWLDHSQRDAAGYLTSPERTFSTGSYALTTDRIDLGTTTDVAPSSVLGTIRIRATSTDPTRPVFIGIGHQDAVDRYLQGVSHATITSWVGRSTDYRATFGSAPTTPPTAAGIWVRSASGVGTRSVRWQPTGGAWTVVVMRPDGAAGVSVSADVGATVPALRWVYGGILTAGGLLLIGAAVLIVVPIVLASRRPRDGVAA